MPTVAGVDECRSLRGLQGISGDLAKGLVSFGAQRAQGGALSGVWEWHSSVVQSWGIVGVQEPLFGGEIFEKILVRPRRLDLGYVLGGSTTPVEVWNTHAAEVHLLSGVLVSGVGGVVVVGPAPLNFGPGQSQVYTISVALQGSPTIDSTVTWTFAGESGATLQVVGTRLVVFSAPMDWSNPYEETPAWLTSVLSAINGAEQRARMRQAPRYEVSFRVLTMTETNTLDLESLLYGWQHQRFGVPVWPESSALLSAVSEGTQILPVSTVDRQAFLECGFAMVWASMQAWEAFQVLEVRGDSISIDVPLVQSWPSGTRVVPLRLGRLPKDQNLGRPTNWLTSDTFTFACEAVL